jgi:uncharacterized membrane protein
MRRMEPTLTGAAAPKDTARSNTLTLAAAALLLVGTVVFAVAAPGSYEIYKLLHVVFAVVWVGGGTGLLILSLLAQRANEPHELAVLVKYAEQLGMKVFTPSGAIVVLFGAILTEKAGWGWGSFWIDFALVIWAVSFVVGAAVLGPTAKKIKEAYAASGGELTPEIEALQRRILAIMRFDVVLLLLIVIDMTAKPSF